MLSDSEQHHIARTGPPVIEQIKSCKPQVLVCDNYGMLRGEEMATPWTNTQTDKSTHPCFGSRLLPSDMELEIDCAHVIGCVSTILKRFGSPDIKTARSPRLAAELAYRGPLHYRPVLMLYLGSPPRR